MCTKNIAIFLNVTLLSLMLTAETQCRGSGGNGVICKDDRCEASIIKSIETLPISYDYNPHGCYLCEKGFVLRQLNATSQKTCARQVEICSLDERCKPSSSYILKIPDVIDDYKVTHIAPQAFAYDQKIVAVAVGSNVCQIGRGAFCGCSNLVSVSMSDCAFHPMSILDEAFYRCGRLVYLKLPAGLKMVGGRAFSECSSLKDVNLPDSCDTMAENAFFGCQSLRTIYIGTIGKYDDYRLLSAFLNCSSLEKISVHPDNPTYEIQNGALYYKDLKAIVRCPAKLGSNMFVINDNVEVVCPFAFEGCQFSEIILPKSLVGIGRGAFANCTNLVSISIPAGVELIEDYAFWGDSNLVSVVINNNQALSVGTNVFPLFTKIVGR